MDAARKGEIFGKGTYLRETFHAVLAQFFRSFWTPPDLNSTQPGVFAGVFAGVLADTAGFSPREVEDILAAAGTQDVKEMLTRVTLTALDKDDFGAPWLWVTNGEGVTKPFFGSNRFHHIYKFLRLPYRDVVLLPPGAKSKL